MQQSHMQEQLLDMFLFLGSEWILHILVVLSVLSVGIALERAIHFWARREDYQLLKDNIDQHLATGDIEGARTTLQASHSHVAQIVLRALDGLARGPGAVEEIVGSATQLAKLQMERGLAFLGTLGNNAPFIGLFGTVLGIIRAFQDLSANTGDATTAVMAGIAEALVATAVGLLVALPAVAIFNAFSRVIKRRLQASDAIAKLVLAHAKTVR